MYNVDLRELGELDCYEELSQAYLELYFACYNGTRIIELYNSDDCGLFDTGIMLSYREYLYKIIKMFNYGIVDKFVAKKHEEFERKRIERNCEEEEGETDD